jgi:hypothetical protein
VGLGGRDAVEPRLHDQLLADQAIGARAAALPHVADLAAHPGRIGGEIVARDRGAARRGPQQRGEHAQRGGLARAVGPEEADQLTRRDVDVHPGHGLHRTPAGAERAGQPAGSITGRR